MCGTTFKTTEIAFTEGYVNFSNIATWAIHACRVWKAAISLCSFNFSQILQAFSLASLEFIKWVRHYLQILLLVVMCSLSKLTSTLSFTIGFLMISFFIAALHVYNKIFEQTFKPWFQVIFGQNSFPPKMIPFQVGQSFAKL